MWVNIPQCVARHESAGLVVEGYMCVYDDNDVQGNIITTTVLILKGTKFNKQIAWLLALWMVARTAFAYCQ